MMQVNEVFAKARSLPKAAWGVIALLVSGVVYAIVRWLGASGTVVPVEAQEHRPSEDEKELWAMQAAAAEKKRMWDHAQALKQRLAETSARMVQNNAEAQGNQASFKQMFGGGKASYDDDMQGFENEQNIDTAFMLKDDMDGKKQGMVALGKELGEQQKFLFGEAEGMRQMLLRLNHEWTGMFPGDAPLYAEQPGPPQPPPAGPEEAAARAHFEQRQGTMMPDGITDGTGREALPV